MSEARRQFTVEFKQEAVQLIERQRLSVSEAARRLDVGANLLRKWRKQFGEAAGQAVAGPNQPSALEAENHRLREENARLRMEREILKKATAFLREGVEMRYRFIDEHRARWPITLQCEVLRVSRSGYYAWRGRGLSRTAQRRAQLTAQIREVHQASRHTYGSPRVHAELLASGQPCDRKTVARCMKQAGIQAKSRRRFRVKTTDSNHSRPIAANVVNRNFRPAKKNETWVADITYIPTGEGWLYLAAVEDLFTREIVGWSMSERIDSRLVVDALSMALARKCPGTSITGSLVAHSDRGVQYASEHYQRLLKEQGITCSMSRRGNCWDNAPMESFFATLKKELVHHEQYATRSEARQSLFEYIEVFYNRVRRHSALSYQAPAMFAEAA
ncbi:MAG: IS3 family transposase [Planctomycetaceae bacterium]